MIASHGLYVGSQPGTVSCVSSSYPVYNNSTVTSTSLCMSAKHRWQNIRRKDQEDNRTPQKDDVANYVDELIETGEWPVPLTQVADETGYSRSHVTNTLEDYYNTVGESETVEPENHQLPERVTIEFPPNVDRETYLQGWINGYLTRKNSE